MKNLRGKAWRTVAQRNLIAPTTKLQQSRMEQGRVESLPGDYRNYATQEEKRRRDARAALEERKMLRELGLD